MNAIIDLFRNLWNLLACIGELPGYVLRFVIAFFQTRASLAARLVAAESQLGICKRRAEQKGSPRFRFTAGWATYEVAGKDLGFVRQGWWQNFQMHPLQIGAEDVGRLRLIDEFDNQLDYDCEALYVRYLRVGSGSLLDLNGLNLYYFDGEIASDAVMLGGQPERLASPAWALLCDLDMDGSVGLGGLGQAGGELR